MLFSQKWIALTCFLFYTAILFTENTKYECFWTFFILIFCFFEVTSHMSVVSQTTWWGSHSRMVLEGRLGVWWCQAAILGCDAHSDQGLWEQTHHRWQRDQQVTFVPVIASCVLSHVPEKTRGKWEITVPCGILAQNAHRWSQHMCCGSCLSRNRMCAKAGGGLIFSDMTLYPAAEMLALFS